MTTKRHNSTPRPSLLLLGRRTSRVEQSLLSKLAGIALLLLISLPLHAKAPSTVTGFEDLPTTATVLPLAQTEAQIIERLRNRGLHTVEGLWEYASTGTRVLIERIPAASLSSSLSSSTLYTITILRSNDLELRRGTVIGYLRTAAQPDNYDARIYTRQLPLLGTLTNPEPFVARITDNGSRLSATPYGTRLRFNWWRLAPYSYRGLLTMTERDPGEITGFIRVYPLPTPPINPRYL